MSNPVQYLIEWSIKPDGADKFKKLGAAAIDAVRSGEPGTLGYQWYFNADGNKCYLSESFDSSESLLTHLENIGPVLPQFLEISDITRFEVFGNLSDAATAAVGGMQAVVHGHWDGFAR